MPTDEPTPQQRWSMLQALAVAAVPFAIALVGHLYTSALKEREIQARMVELAVAILQAPPDTATYNLRSWAIRVVNQYSRVPLDSLVAADLRKAVPLPAPQTTDPEAPSGGSGLPPGTPVPLTLNLPWPAHVTYRRWTSKDLVRELGQFPKGVTDTTLPYGGYVYFLAASLTTRDTLTRNAHCEQGCSVEF